MKLPREAALGLAIVGAVAVGFAGGRWTSDSAPPVVETGVAAAAEASHSHSLEDEQLGTDHDPGPQGQAQALEDGAGEAVAVDDREAEAAIERGLAAAEAAFKAPDDHHLEEALAAAAGELEVTLSSSHSALATALERFARLRDPAQLEFLAAVLGRIRDPEVEQAVLQIAEQDPDVARRTAAFDVLDALDTPQARQAALATLSREVDVDLRRAALRAIPEPRGASREEAAGVAAAAVRVLGQDPDTELRRRAALVLGRWHSTASDLGPVLSGLASDPSIDVRAGCAFALEIAGRQDPAVLEALVQAVSTSGEDPAVRENAWRALGAQGPLPAAAHAAWLAYQDAMESTGEGMD